MPFFDLPLEELREYRSQTVAPNDLDAYWEEAIGDAREAAAPAVFEPWKPEAYGPLEAFDVTFSGAAGHPVPRSRQQRDPRRADACRTPGQL